MADLVQVVLDDNIPPRNREIVTMRRGAARRALRMLDKANDWPFSEMILEIRGKGHGKPESIKSLQARNWLPD